MRFFLGLLLSLSLCFSTLVYTVNAHSENNIFMNTTSDADAETASDITTEHTAAPVLTLTASSALLMDAATGTVLFEQNAAKERPIASVTKIMTLLLIFQALHNQTIQLEDLIPVSAHAASMGGSQVYLEEGETQTVETLIKCIVVASANDACVAMAEQLAGSEEAFVQQMNETAASLGMLHTHFANCCGLDTEGHLTTARDIALMSRELITKYPQIEDYSTIWMENITHTTAKGSSEFGLSNTNKLIRQYEYATGLKTGSTSGAKFCLSATARKDGVNMIAVVMAEPDSKTRIKDAIAMLNYGFGKCSIYQDEKALEKIVYAEVKHGMQEKAKGETLEGFRYVDTSGSDLSAVEKEVQIQKQTAPVKKGDQIGEVIYRLNEKTIGSVPVYATEGVGELTFGGAFLKILEEMMV